MKTKIAIVLPCYNEEEILPRARKRNFMALHAAGLVRHIVDMGQQIMQRQIKNSTAVTAVLFK